MWKNWSLPLSLAVLSLLSLVMIQSLQPSLAFNQFLYLVLAWTIFGVTSWIPFTWWQKTKWWWFGLVLFGLFFTLIFGNVTRGSTRWINVFGIIRIQPSQFSVMVLALVLPTFFKHKNHLVWLIKTGLVAGIMILAILLEPDLGTSILASTAVLGTMFVRPLPIKWIVTGLFLAVIGAILSWQFVLQPYQKNRILGFIGGAEVDTYNATQAQIAAGSGGLWGKGLGKGTQTQLGFLPEKHTDFIFASIGEELGIAGMLLVVACYTIIGGWLVSAIMGINSNQIQFFLIAFFLSWLLQTFVNIGMNIGIAPITGVTLPFVSYGGSSLVAFSLLFGVAYNTRSYWPAVQQDVIQ